jgi:Spx/MgsR family transcriptional regulator
MLTLYGIKNCDSVKKARTWLQQHALAYHFHDYNVDGVTPELVQQFAVKLGWEVLLNKRSTTWRQLSEAQKTAVNADTALPLLLAYPTLIKRPILIAGTVFLIGFNADEYQRLL